MIDRELYSEIMKANQQFPDNPEDSNLWKSIQMVSGMTDGEAQEAAKFHCNSLSFYGLCRAHGWIMFPYGIWLEKIVEKDFFDIRTGWVKASKLRIAELFGFGDRFNDLIYVYNYEALMTGKGIDKDKGINIKVYSNYNQMNLRGKGDHFMGGYYINDELFLDDSGRRGYKVKARDVIPRPKLQWGLIV